MWTRLRALASRLAFMVARRRVNEEMRIEIDAHLELLTERYQRQGLTRHDAYLAARRQFGSIVGLRQHIHEANGIIWADHLVQDVRHALRQLARSPAFAAVVVITLALGIGSTTAIFSVVEAVLLRPLPYPESDRIVRLIERRAEPANEIGYQQSLAAIWTRDLATLRAATPTLSHVGAYSSATATVLIDHDNPLRLEGTRLSPAVLDMLGAQPAIGRIFLPTEETASTEPVVILSHEMWQRFFGGRADVVGRNLVVDGTTSIIVGVMPRDFQFPDARTLFWQPFALDARLMRIAPIARLADGATSAAASSNVNAVMQQIRRTEPRGPGTTSSTPSQFEARTLQEDLVGPVRPLILTLALAVAFLLIIACVNVTNALLNRNAARRHELTLRVALGASPGRVVRYVLTETLIVVIAGGALGVLLASATISMLHELGTGLARRDLTPGVSIPRLDEIHINGTALVFAAVATAGAGLLVALLPIARYAFDRRIDALKNSLNSMASVHAAPSPRGRAALLVAQTALATIALIGGGLMVQSFVRLAGVDPGYNAAGLLTFTVRSSSGAGSVAFSEEVAERLRQLPGVKAAGYTELLPMVRFRVGGPLRPAQPMPAGTPPAPTPIEMRTVSHDFTAAMGMTIVAGRPLRADDERAVLMNETLARSGFLGPQALGQHVFVAAHPDPFEVVGIVGDVRQYGLDQDPDPQVFVDARQLPPGNPTPYFALRVEGNPISYASPVRETVADIDASAVLDNVATMQQVVTNSLSRPRLFAVLAGAYATVGALLAAIGVYGVTAYAVTQRTRELAIRLALGARPIALLVLVIRHGVGWTVVGLTLGIIGSAALSRYLDGVLFGITPLDATTFAVVSAMFLVVAVVATLIPARWTTRIDPLIALRTQ